MSDLLFPLLHTQLLFYDWPLLTKKNIHPKMGQKTMRAELVSRNRLKTYVWHYSRLLSTSLVDSFFGRKNYPDEMWRRTMPVGGCWHMTCLLFCLLRNTLGLSRQIQLIKLEKYCMKETAILVEWCCRKGLTYICSLFCREIHLGCLDKSSWLFWEIPHKENCIDVGGWVAEKADVCLLPFLPRNTVTCLDKSSWANLRNPA